MPAHLLLSAVLLASPSPPGFTAPTGALRGVWTDGDGLLAVIEYGAIDLSCRTGERVRLESTDRLFDVAGAWVDGAPVVAATTEGGELLQWRRGAWSVIRVPRSDVHDLIAVAVDERGRVLVAGSAHEAHRLDGDRWDTLPYPTDLSSVRSLAARGDGEFFVAERYGRMLRGSPGQATPQPLRVNRPRIGAAWIGATGPLWLAGEGNLTAVDPVLAHTTKSVDTAVFNVRALTGLPGADGLLLAVAGERGVAVYDGEKVTSVTGAPSATDLAFDLRGAALLIVGERGLVTLPIDHPAMRAARARLPATTLPCPLPPGQRVQTVDALRPVPKASLSAKLPAAPSSQPLKTAPVRERPQVTLRFGLGPAFAPGSAPRPRIATSLDLDLALGVVFQPRRYVYLWPELGYSYNGRGGQPGHFVIAGLTPLFGSRGAQVGVAARLVAGDAWHAPGVGLRSGLVGSFGMHALTLELGHQWLRAGGRDLHDARIVISLDLVLATKAVAVLMIFTAFARALRK